MLDRIWEAVVQAAITLFLPLVCTYFEINSDLFWNGAYEESRGIEWVADQLLAPCHYLFLGQTISHATDGDWEFKPRFDYSKQFEWKAVASTITALPSFVLGSIAKGICMIDPNIRARYRSIERSYTGKGALRPFSPIQIACSQIAIDPVSFIPKQIARKPGAQNHLSVEKRALKEITNLLTDAGISWWVDCGTCLGVYRHGGVIPWDEDLDIALFRSEFENARRLLHRLDRKKYLVQDWSSREHPNSLMKVFVRENGSLIDIYFFDFHEEKNEISFVFSLENGIFFPEWWKIRERRYKAPISLNHVFPLKRSSLDGIEVFVPREIEAYLQRYYGENLAPVKVYDPQTDQYVKDLSHPYWQRQFAH